jgi:hypothetical protein
MAETVAAALAEAGASPQEIATAMKAALAGKPELKVKKSYLSKKETRVFKRILSLTDIVQSL